jgi:hypothetical protein
MSIELCLSVCLVQGIIFVPWNKLPETRIASAASTPKDHSRAGPVLMAYMVGMYVCCLLCAHATPDNKRGDKLECSHENICRYTIYYKHVILSFISFSFKYVYKNFQPGT